MSNIRRRTCCLMEAAALFTVRRKRRCTVPGSGGDCYGQTTIAHRGQKSTFTLPSGHIVFARGSALFAVPFDANRLELAGPAVRLLDGVRTDGNDTHFAMALDGTLAYIPELSRDSRLVWFSRQGNSRPLDSERRLYTHPRISPDGTRVVLNRSARIRWIGDLDLRRRTRNARAAKRERFASDLDGRREAHHVSERRKPLLRSGRRQQRAPTRAQAGRSIHRSLSTRLV